MKWRCGGDVNPSGGAMKVESGAGGGMFKVEVVIVVVVVVVDVTGK